MSSPNSAMDLLTLMGIISQLESQTIPQTNLNSPKYVNTPQRIFEQGHKLVPKNTGTPRRYHNLMGNAKTNKRI